MKSNIYDVIIKYCYGDNISKIKKTILQKIESFITNKSSIEFVLPSFPGKSPNNRSSFDGKFGYEEKYSIDTITKMLNEIEEIYPYGAKIYIVHDGHLFQDLGITRSNKELDDYIRDFRKNIDSNRIISISLMDLTMTNTYEEARNKIINNYNSSSEKEKLDGSILQNEILFTKREFEKQLLNGDVISNNQFQNIAKKIAKNSMIRKEALSKYIDEKYTNQIRLSIHFQNSNSLKLGFKLIDRAINFGSPWFNVIYKCTNGDIILGKNDWFIDSRVLVHNDYGNYYSIDSKTECLFKNNILEKKLQNDIKLGR